MKHPNPQEPKQESVQNSVCSCCNKHSLHTKPFRPGTIRPGVLELILKDHPNWSEGQPICDECLNQYRSAYVRLVLERDRGDLDVIEQLVVGSFEKEAVLAQNLNEEFDNKATFGEKLADKVASFGGSWSFIILFGSVIVVWVAVNSFVLMQRGFDPYPFILLNLVLSCLAALQAPVIMMSQNRQEVKDRMRAENDYRTNLKAELEVRQLHEKVDHLLTHQMERLMEIQEIQMEMLRDISEGKSNPNM
ncbi:MAG: DUF1003 domain-containing protein [Fimbriimonas sp.]